MNPLLAVAWVALTVCLLAGACAIAAVGLVARLTAGDSK